MHILQKIYYKIVFRKCHLQFVEYFFFFYYSRLFKKFKREKNFLIGHSFGTTLSLRLLKEFPEQISKICLIGTPDMGGGGLFSRI